MTQKERARRYRQRRNRRIALTMAMVLLTAVFAIGGTIAWLTDSTKPIENTFTAGDISIRLKETFNAASIEGGAFDHWTAKLIPGTTCLKDPVVEVDEGSEDCYLFVRFEEKNTPQDYLVYSSLLTSGAGWTKLELEGVTDVWYREVPADAEVRSWNLLDNDTVFVREELTKEDMPGADASPSLVYTAYACQSANMTVADAWAAVLDSLSGT